MDILSIIGSAGRQSDAKLISTPLYDAMYAEVVKVATEWQVSRFRSGGAAFAGGQSRFSR